jgi:hypothetical protein
MIGICYNIIQDTRFALASKEVNCEDIDRVLWQGDNLYRIGFLPSVLAWVALDYTDDVCNQAAAMHMKFNSQCRQIRILSQQFNSYYNNKEMGAVNELNGIGLQEQFSECIGELRHQLSEHIHYCKPGLNASMLTFYVSVYMAIFAFRALFNYTFECDMYLDSQVRSYNAANRSILLPHAKHIYKILPEFLGADAALVCTTDLDVYSQRLVDFIKSAEFVNEKKSI